MIEELVGLLDRDGNREDAEHILKRMLRDLWGERCEEVRVRNLPQGFSGAQVLLVQPRVPDSDASGRWHVIKIVPKGAYWSIQNCDQHWDEIREALHPTAYDEGHLPVFVTPVTPCGELHRLVNGQKMSSRLVSSGKFYYAAAFDFLGPQIGQFLNFEQAYRMHCQPPAALPRGFLEPGGSLAEALLHQLFAHLEQTLYSGASCEHNEAREFWSDKSAPAESVLTPPPYRLTARQRIRILHHLDQIDAWGRRILGVTWQDDAKAVRTWVRYGHQGKGSLSQPRRVTRSHVHGDMNRYNILFWIEKGRFFLIDFDLYQPLGHAMQDFAKLEAEVKFALMDSETCEAHALQALDLTCGQMESWCQLEDQLASGDWRSAAELVGKRVDLVNRAGKLIRTIRTEAARIHGGALGQANHDSFMIEYGGALLYHTLRAIAFAVTSPLKRLLAVYSGARLIDLLNASPKAALATCRFSTESSGNQRNTGAKADDSCGGTLDMGVEATS